MKNQYSSDDLEFQQDVRRFLREQLPEEIRQKVLQDQKLEKSEHVRWQKILFQQGWAAPNWPEQYGGTGWTATQKYIFANECAATGAPEFIPFGLKMVAPVIYTYGNEEQKKRFLPDILRSNVWWCQGYSEPNAGSDLASLKLSACLEGDHYLLNGTKTWTTYAHYADWMFCLVRTGSPDSKNQEAISFLLLAMDSPGVTVSPIITIDGKREVNEVHFDNVRVPVSNRIGDEGNGWTYAKVLLTHERTGIAKVGLTRRRLGSLKTLVAGMADNDGTWELNPVFAHRLAEIEIDLLALEFTEMRTLASVATGQAPGPESSILKIKGTELAQAVDELYLQAVGYYGLSVDADPSLVSDATMVNRASVYFNHRKLSIYGGSNEIQRNIIAKSVLGL